MEWVNSGVLAPEVLPGVFAVRWSPAGQEVDEGSPVVTTVYDARRDVRGRYRVHVETTYRVGVDEASWVHSEVGAGSAEAYPTKREALTWARRMAEMEAANAHAVSWDGVPT